jgi:hypothetical protein
VSPTPSKNPVTSHSKETVARSVAGGKIERPVDDDQFGSGKAGTQADVTLEGITIRGKDAKAVIEDIVTSARLTRTIEGASTIVIVVNDYDRKIMKSSMANEASDLTIQGMKFVLVKVRKTGESLELTFEDWAVAQLRKKTGPKKAVRGQVTRAQFAEQLVKEVKGLKFYSPEKAIKQEIYPYDDHNVTETEAPTGTPVSGSGGGGGSGTWKNWARDFLNLFNWPETQQNYDALLAWISAESGGSGRRASFNPLNTTHSQGAISNFNSVPVRNYPNWDVGLEANRLTLASDASAGYATVRGYFALGTNAAATCAAIDVSGWGTQHSADHLPSIQADRAKYERMVVAGASATPARNRDDADTSQTEDNQRGQQPGFDDGATFQVAGTAANIQQIRNIERILKKGDAMGMNEWIMASAVLCVMRDSGAINRPINESPTREEDIETYTQRFGLFQFKVSDYPGIQGWTLEQQAEKYFQKAKYFFNLDMQSQRVGTPDRPRVVPPLHKLVNDVTRRSMESFEDYGARYTEDSYVIEAVKATELFLHHHLAYGGRPVGPSTGPDADSFDQEDYNEVVNAGARQTVIVEPYEFSRGTPEQPEDSWTCLQRLADEVNWRCFCVNRTIYFCRDKVLLKNKAMDKIGEFDDGVDYIDFDYDVGKPMSMITVQCRADRWSTIPGSTVVIEKMGPATGRYIVQTFERSFHSDRAEITLIGAQPQLLEPAPDTHVESIDPDGPGGENHGPGGGPGLSAQPWDPELMDGAKRVVRWALSKVRPPGPTSYRLYPSTHRGYDAYVSNPNYDGPWDCSSFCSDAWAKVEVDIAGTTGGIWQKCKSKDVTIGGKNVNGIGIPPGGWKPGDLIWTKPPEGVGGAGHILMATGEGTGSVEAQCTRCGIVRSNRATSDVGWWARPADLIPASYRTQIPDPDVVDPRTRIT